MLSYLYLNLCNVLEEQLCWELIQCLKIKLKVLLRISFYAIYQYVNNAMSVKFRDRKAFVEFILENPLVCK